ncbi:MAG TPA: hypothetical protein PLH09_09005 [Lentimicrobium sp.]|nr:hypothetical protein [Lentimicrobium sp.]
MVISGPVKSVSDMLEKNNVFEIVGRDNVCADINLALERAGKLLEEVPLSRLHQEHKS